MDDLNKVVDAFYKGQSVPPEVVKLIGTALLRTKEGQSPEQIGVELNLPPERAKELVIRAKGWELSHQLENERSHYK